MRRKHCLSFAITDQWISIKNALFKDIYLRAYRKTMLVVPNAEHCGSTARTSEKWAVYPYIIYISISTVPLFEHPNNVWSAKGFVFLINRLIYLIWIMKLMCKIVYLSSSAVQRSLFPPSLIRTKRKCLEREDISTRSDFRWYIHKIVFLPYCTLFYCTRKIKHCFKNLKPLFQLVL